ncbi:MAG: iron ABC transporter permease [Bacteroidales bacterium]|nr:iron ABC transporter permease [Bacteroidales bacterium]
MNYKKVQKDYLKYTARKKLFIIISFLFLILFIFIGITFGSAKIAISDIFSALFGSSENTITQIIVNIRLPRVLSAVLAGIALSVSGVVMQSILKNPLGSPFTLGISNAAAFGAAFAVIVLHAGTLHSSTTDSVIINNPYLISVSAFFWSLTSVIIVLLMTKLRGISSETLILTGIILGSLFLAATTAMEYFADDMELASIIFWTFGDLGRASWRDFFILFALIIPAFLFFIRNRWNYNLLDTGDETAKSLGVNVNKVRIFGLIIASLITSITVSFFGIIAFVGLVVPHIIRRIIGNDERFLIPASAIFGGVFLLICDTIARTIISPIVLPVGIITSFVGAPLFIFLLIKRKGRGKW